MPRIGFLNTIKLFVTLLCFVVAGVLAGQGDWWAFAWLADGTLCMSLVLYEQGRP